MPEIVIARIVTKIVSSDEFFMLRAGFDRSTCKTVFVNDALWLRSSNSHMPLLLIRTCPYFLFVHALRIRTRSKFLIAHSPISYSHTLQILIRIRSYFLSVYVRTILTLKEEFNQIHKHTLILNEANNEKD